MAEAGSIKSIYRLYSCSLPGTFSSGTLGTGSCESCPPDSHPAWTHRERKNLKKKKKNQKIKTLQPSAGFYATRATVLGPVLLPGGQSPGERPCCYPAEIDLLPRSSSQASFPSTSVPSRWLLRKCAPSITLDWITPAPLQQQRSAQLLTKLGSSPRDLTLRQKERLIKIIKIPA